LQPCPGHQPENRRLEFATALKMIRALGLKRKTAV
jgi:hypothetical protein